MDSSFHIKHLSCYNVEKHIGMFTYNIHLFSVSYCLLLKPKLESTPEPTFSWYQDVDEWCVCFHCQHPGKAPGLSGVMWQQ